MDISISTLLQQATSHLQSCSDSPTLDAEILLAYVLQKERVYLKAWGSKPVDEKQVRIFNTLVRRRLLGEPVAYIVGYKEFWSLMLKVNPSVLIPRSETELLVEKILEYLPREKALHILELGTGSGAIALALAKECPNWHIVATDKSVDALAIAEGNAARTQVRNVSFQYSDWFSHLQPTQLFHAVISNPPYINFAERFFCSKEIAFEPKEALFADESGIADLKHIICTAPQYLYANGWLFLEHGFDQKITLQEMMLENDYTEVQDFQDMSSLDRMIIGKILK